MSYNKALVSDKQKAMMKSITELLNVLSDIAISDTDSNNGEIILDDGSVMTLGVDKISVTNARLNLDVRINKKGYITQNQEDIIRLVKKKPETIILKRKKETSDE